MIVSWEESAKQELIDTVNHKRTLYVDSYIMYLLTYRAFLKYNLLILFFRNLLDDRTIDNHQKAQREYQRNHFCNRNCPPYCTKATKFCQYIGYRYQSTQLTHNRYDHTENCFSQCLEYSSGNDAEPCNKIMNADDTKCRNSDGQHILRSTEHTQKYLWDSFKCHKTDESKVSLLSL